MNEKIKTQILLKLNFLYGEDQTETLWPELASILDSFCKVNPEIAESTPLDTFSKLSSILITYGDQIHNTGEKSLKTLGAFFHNYLNEIIPAIHILPFYPYSSDDGFSVIDYYAVDKNLGMWEDIHKLRNDCVLMFDGVVNHISRQSQWFQSYLVSDQDFRDYFIEANPQDDLSNVVRPRALPLLTQVETTNGISHVWTTFSADQIDLNFKNPKVLLEIVKVFLHYISHGAKIIRLDAIAYIWKELGTTCVSLDQTHAIVKLFRSILNYAAPGVLLITETNVPHQENISYFGEPTTQEEYYGIGNESQLVYQFPLAPLVLHTFRCEDSYVLTRWASSLPQSSTFGTFFNFLASHDGIGLRPAEELLEEEDVQALVDQVKEHGGKVSYRDGPNGIEKPYELNITFYDALNHPMDTSEEQGIQRFLASQSIMLSLAGVPGIYFHSLLGSSNSFEEFQISGKPRSLNRHKFELRDLEKKLLNLSSRESIIFHAYLKILSVRKDNKAFDIFAPQQILDMDKRVFAIKRTSTDSKQEVVCLTNVSSENIVININSDLLNYECYYDLLQDGEITLNLKQGNTISLKPYQITWLANGNSPTKPSKMGS